MITLEKGYGNTLKGLFFTINPIKKKIIKTYCIVHKYINIQAVELLSDNGYVSEAKLYKKYIKSMNEGVTWADQDFKSSNHFYHLNKQRGLYGFSNLLTEFKKYYGRASGYYSAGDFQKSMFFLGVASHMIQDATVPQHTDNKLLQDHREFEQWIIRRLLLDFSYTAEGKPTEYTNLDDYIINNAGFARNTMDKYKNLRGKEERYHMISMDIVKEAEKTTAGLFLHYYKENVFSKEVN